MTHNPRLEQEKGGELTVRIGLHTGPAVVGEMGGSGRHAHLAPGKTVTMATLLVGLAAALPGVSAPDHGTTHTGASALEDVGLQGL